MQIHKKHLLILFLCSILFIFLLGCSQSPDTQPDNGFIVPKAICINQEGYLPNGEKYFITNISSSSFSLISTINQETVYTGIVTQWKKNDPATGLTTYIGDFSAFIYPGEYYITIDSGQTSFNFIIATDVFNDVAEKAIKSFYFQRCGTDLLQTDAGAFAHSACHTNNSTYHISTEIFGTSPTQGGWHDAGDYGKYIPAAAVSLGTIFLLYEKFPNKFDTESIGIPESSNNISDYLDEIRVELEWMLTMQNQTPADQFYGAVHYMVNTLDYEWVVPASDTAIQYLYDYSSVATADFAAIMAWAYRLYNSTDSTFADSCLDAAEVAWTFLSDNPAIYPTGGFIRPADTDTGGYVSSADVNDTDDRLWAAVELLRSTNDSSYNTYILDNTSFSNSSSFNEGLDWTNTIGFAKIGYILAENSNINNTLQTTLEQQFITRCNTIIDDLNSDGFLNALTRYYWGCNGGQLVLAEFLLIGDYLTAGGNPLYYNGALKQLNCILGINAYNISFVTITGTNSTKNIHHAALETDGIAEAFPGILAGGPNPDIYADNTLPLYFDYNTPPALCYIDHVDSWASNENCILYNAPLAAVSAYFADF